MRCCCFCVCLQSSFLLHLLLKHFLLFYSFWSRGREVEINCEKFKQFNSFREEFTEHLTSKSSKLHVIVDNWSNFNGEIFIESNFCVVNLHDNHIFKLCKNSEIRCRFNSILKAHKNSKKPCRNSQKEIYFRICYWTDLQPF